MSDIKYTNDGKKVSVIGKINKTEFIVQEIFISDDGSEIPSGENFTAKSLHDAPVKSWKEKEIEKIEARHNKAKNEIQLIESELRSMRKERSDHASIIRSNLRQIKEIENLDLGMLPDVMARNVKWVCSTGYDWANVKSFDEFITIRSAYDDGVKLISVHANKNNNIFYKVGSYSDGSGNNSEYKFFNNKEALNKYLEEKANEYIESERMTIHMFDSASKYIELPKTIREKLVNKEIEQAEDYYQKELKRITEFRDKSLSLQKQHN